MGLGISMGVKASAEKSFPLIHASQAFADGTLNTLKNIPFPSSYPVAAAGDMILVVMTGYADSGVVMNTPAGCTPVTGAAYLRLHHMVFYRIATGGEAGVPVSGNVNFYASGNVFILKNAVAAEGATTNGPETTPNAPAKTASWGSDPHLFIASEGQFSVPTGQSAPAGYSNFGQAVPAIGGNDRPRTAWATINSTNAGEDPGAFGAAVTVGGSHWVASTTVVRGA